MLKKIQNIKIRVLIVHLIITLAYPAVKAFISEYNRLLIFTDAMTIVACILLIGGIVYALVLRGDFDISGFLFKRGTQKENKQSFQAYLADLYEKREEAFNYPLFLGIIYLIAAILISYCFL